MSAPRSLSGHSLEGDVLVRLVYVDEAGIGNPKEEPILTVGAVIVHADKQLVAVERALDKLVKRHIPEVHWPTFVFHATHLFNWGGAVFTKNNPDWPLSRRLEIADEIAAIPHRYGLCLAIGICERAKFPSDPAIRANLTKEGEIIAAHAVTFSACAMKVDLWMRQNAPTEICMVIVEDNHRMRSHLRFAQNYLQSPLHDDEQSRYFPLKKIKEDPLFQPKRPSSVLQLADFWTYIGKRIAMNPSDDRWHRFYEPMKPHVWEPFQQGLPS
jgi:hypothetical protein